MSIEVNKVVKKYGSQAALNNVSFSVKEGEIVGFLGPNGAGKSTMMKIITCYLEQTEGNVSVCGFNVQEDALKVKSLVGYLPESNPLYYDMYVKEYLMFIAGVHKLKNKKERVIEIIHDVGLNLEEHKRIGELSKGYKQRVGLAQALIHNPKVLILDEPTSGLDPNQLVEIRNLIKRVGKEKTVLMSSHIMQEIEAICSRVIIINRGDIVADEQVDVIKHSLDANKGILVEFREDVTEEQLLEIEKVGKVNSRGTNKWLLLSDDKSDIRENIFKHSVSQKWNIISLTEEETKLEEVFKSLTSK
jgi:ABC-2 type transport system ATP-binding protein|tara:strand:+ start:34 stop:942 length:909 start_codon:yes stop_codon:yes gene_type:complete